MPVSFHFVMFRWSADRSSSPPAVNGVVMGNKRLLSSLLESRVVRALLDDGSDKMRGIITKKFVTPAGRQMFKFKL